MRTSNWTSKYLPSDCGLMQPFTATFGKRIVSEASQRNVQSWGMMFPVLLQRATRWSKPKISNYVGWKIMKFLGWYEKVDRKLLFHYKDASIVCLLRKLKMKMMKLAPCFYVEKYHNGLRWFWRWIWDLETTAQSTILELHTRVLIEILSFFDLFNKITKVVCLQHF